MSHRELLDPVERFVDLEAIELHYMEYPSTRPAMILLHGIGMDWRVWQGVARRLTPYFGLLLPDLRGHGKSSKPSRGYSLAHYASDIEELVTRLNLQGATLVGSSLGAMVAVALEAPSAAVATRILVDPPLMVGSGSKRTQFEDILCIKQSGVAEEDQRQLIFRTLQGESEGAGNAFVRYMAEAWARCAEGVLVEALHPIEKPRDIDAVLGAIEVPTLIMRGNQERGGVLSEASADRALGLLRNGELKDFPKSGHAIHGSEPAKFVQAILEFTRTVTGVAA